MSNTYRKDYYKSSWVKDNKPWYKPNKEFKQIKKRSRKAKEKQALRVGAEIIPEFPKTDVWEWN